MPVATRTDEEIKKDVVDQLYWDGRVDASDVRVEVTEGTVTLSGTVPNYTAYDGADEDAWAMAGVKYVRNELTIKFPPGTEVPTDIDIRANIENVLLWQPDIDSTNIDVAVENGWVTLKGSVHAFWQKVRAEELILSLSGVLGLTNELAVVPTEKFVDKAIADSIEAALDRDFNVDADLIDVRVENGKVTLTGSVPSLPAFRAVKRIVESTPGVLMVENELIIR